MSWWLVALVAWTMIAVLAAVLLGAAARTAGEWERHHRVPSFVPEHWSLTHSR